MQNSASSFIETSVYVTRVIVRDTDYRAANRISHHAAAVLEWAAGNKR